MITIPSAGINNLLLFLYVQHNCRKYLYSLLLCRIYIPENQSTTNISINIQGGKETENNRDSFFRDSNTVNDFIFDDDYEGISMLLSIYLCI
jgi:hypothetical protein